MNLRVDMTQEQRREFDRFCTISVNLGASTLDEIYEDTQKRLKSHREQWAILLSRSSKLKRQCYEALKRCVARGEVKYGMSRGTHVTWVPVVSLEIM